MDGMDGMDHMNHGSTTSTDTATAVHEMMLPYLHFSAGDYLLFKAWLPLTSGAVVGACFGLLFLAIFERWVSGMRGVLEKHWKHRAMLLSSKYDTPSNEAAKSSGEVHDEISAVEKTDHSLIPSSIAAFKERTIPPFIASHDIPRGLIYAFQAFLGYALMLAAMTFHAGYIISIIGGLSIGEILFGRLGGGSAH